MATASRRTKRAATGIPIALTVQECAAYDAVKQALADAATLAFPKPDAEMVLLTNASDIGWSVIVTRVPSWKSDAASSTSCLSVLVVLSLGHKRTGVSSKKRHTRLLWHATN
ncbi:hypothetical protein PF005_g4088 [Phytophthora fragariae]|nr:hypothetical protein PF003_g20784 [Phytophthora fragariae]KAE8945745.1 hypothetical protein PF009_g4591 [Phytophthora fragariae]KAE9005160.1 hypothetical protein PF011_g12157 [Phytophthora fragariae]KAE9105600.1 hypothetical protein PF010_g12960 [Phytophthora fragariae]KAE9131531.1 hypothetical protein PF007_g4076 [Phytophthora fragariae]